MRIFGYTRPRYGAKWHSVSYRRGWMPLTPLERKYDPFMRSIKALRYDKQQQLKRYKRGRKSMLEELRIQMSFRAYNVRHPLNKRWKGAK